jgi:OPA family glycerol-3-phosphate transporter-like MFS transporter
MAASILFAILAAIVFGYFRANPLKHSRWFITRRFINWFPLGMTYAFMYMGRYNLNVAKNSLGTMMTNQDVGDIFGVGAFVYAVSFLVNGPLVDKIGGKKGIIIGAIGSSLANIALGVLTYLLTTHQLHVRMVQTFAIVYGLNMYFQSYGAVSIIKVKAYWFHVRERGTFAGIFGTLISLGIYFAFDWGQAIAGMAQANPQGEMGWIQRLIQRLFALKGSSVDATWALFYVPAVVLLFWALMDAFLIKDTPEEAGFPEFDAADASSGHMQDELTTAHLLKKVFASKMMLTVAFIGLTVGVVRNGVMNWYSIFAKDTGLPADWFFTKNWGFLVCIFGIGSGFAGGWVSDKFFQSRRGPPAVLWCGASFILAGVMALFLTKSPYLVGWCAVLITMAIVAVHALMAGTAAPDFGGRKATATCSGIADGFVYLGSSLQSFGIGRLTAHGWIWWPLFIMPFAAIGGLLALSIWHALPAATRKFIDEKEQPTRHPAANAPDFKAT